MQDEMTMADLDAERWAAVLAREPKPGCGAFLYGVVTQGVYCRPGCPARAPLRRNVRFFQGVAEADGAVVGAVVFSPFFSTVRGGAGAYVSDLWVSEATRGSGLGRRLLAAARDAAGAEWGARFLKLAVYLDNPRARAFYIRLGFAPHDGEVYLTLGGPALAALGDHR